MIFSLTGCFRTVLSAMSRFSARLPETYSFPFPMHAKFPGIPFAAIYAMRNQLSHGYFAIDLDVIWKVIERDIPELRRELEKAIAELERHQSE